MLTIRPRHQLIGLAAVAGFVSGIAFSPQFADHTTICAIGFMAAVGGCSWLASEGLAESETAAAGAAQAESLVLANRRVDELSGLLEQACTDVTAFTSDRPDHECDIHDALMQIVDDGSLSIRAYNRARAGLAPAAPETPEG